MLKGELGMIDPPVYLIYEFIIFDIANLILVP